MPVVQSFFDVDEGYNFKLLESRTLIQDLRDQMNHFSQECDNSMFTPLHQIALL